VNRADFKALALFRLKDAEALLKSKRYDGAYYLTGYVIECALKACICKKRKRFEFPDKTLATRSYTHDLAELVKAADLADELGIERKTNKPFEVMWKVALLWSEQSRYGRHTRSQAEELHKAVTHPDYGVLQWIKRYW
jgi:HEPN domain-containing protein